MQLQAAIDYATTISPTGSAYGIGKLFCPAGVYGFTQLTMRSGVSFIGEGVGATGGTVFRQLSSASGFVSGTSGYLTGVGFDGIAFQDNASCGHVFDFSAAAHCSGMTMQHFSVLMINPNAAFANCTTCTPQHVVMGNAGIVAAQNHAVPVFNFQAHGSNNIFNLKLHDMLIEGHVNNVAPLVFVSDEIGVVSFNVVFESLDFEPGPGGAIEARRIYTGPTFTNISSADCQDTWPIVHISRGSSALPFGYGPATFAGCNLHNITADNLQSCFAPVIIGSWVGRLNAQGNRPMCIGSRINILEGTTNPYYLGAASPG